MFLEGNHVVGPIADEVKRRFQGEGTGHDWHHIERVTKMALNLARAEGGDEEVTVLGALLHDIADHKFHDGDLTEGPRVAAALLRRAAADGKTIERVVTIVNEVTFKGAGVPTPVSSIEAACVQDADRLDAIGAIGIARAFAYGGAKQRLLHDPESTPNPHASFESYASSTGATTHHFYEKLLLLKDRMNTKAAKEMAIERHAFMEAFLAQFYAEWHGSR